MLSSCAGEGAVSSSVLNTSQASDTHSPKDPALCGSYFVRREGPQIQHGSTDVSFIQSTLPGWCQALCQAVQMQPDKKLGLLL